MTLQTSINQIDELYPVAGKDNNTQGFRDNFSYIKTSLTLANGEITTLKNNSVSKAVALNNLEGTTLYNGLYRDLHGIAHINLDVGSQSIINIDVRNGPLQRFTVTTPIPTFAITNWPGSGSTNRYCNVRIHFSVDTTETLASITLNNIVPGKKYTIVSLGEQSQSVWNTIAGTTGVTYAVNSVFVAAQNGTGAGGVYPWREITFSNTNIVKESSLSFPLLLDPIVTDNKVSDRVIEAWSFDGGLHVFMRDLGTYASAS